MLDVGLVAFPQSRSDRGGAFTLRLEVNTLMLRLRDSAKALPQPERNRPGEQVSTRPRIIGYKHFERLRVYTCQNKYCQFAFYVKMTSLLYRLDKHMNFCKLGLAVIETEAQAIFALSQRLDQAFERACQLLLDCKGRVVVTGMGKSGHIGKKIASTLSSTGTPAFFMHPGEAIHGDLGMITAQDTVIALSHSGQTNEIVTLLPLLKRLDIPLISLSGNPSSILAKTANVHLDVSIEHEACPLGLAPTTSTTVALVMGDALAIALLQARGFSAEDFALSHPGGHLGKRLLLRIDELCHRNEALPIIHENATIIDALLEVTAKKLGMTCVVNDDGFLTGVYTDGDVRRTLIKQHDVHTTPLKEVMTRQCRTIHEGLLAAEALAIMQKHSITSLVVVDEQQRPIAVLHMHALLRAGVF
jgi:arabinose-5-phosphate isomerase